MRLKIYVDEDVPLSLAQALCNRGVDCITTQEAGNKGFSDAEQLAFSAGNDRTIVTHNKKTSFISATSMHVPGKYIQALS